MQPFPAILIAAGIFALLVAMFGGSKKTYKQKALDNLINDEVKRHHEDVKRQRKERNRQRAKRLRVPALIALVLLAAYLCYFQFPSAGEAINNGIISLDDWIQETAKDGFNLVKNLILLMIKAA